MTVFTAGPNAVTQDLAPGDIGYVLRGNGHYIKNIGDTDLQFLEIFRSAYFADVSLSDWLTHTPPAMVAAHLNVDVETIKGWPNDRPLVMRSDRAMQLGPDPGIGPRSKCWDHLEQADSGIRADLKANRAP